MIEHEVLDTLIKRFDSGNARIVDYKDPLTGDAGLAVINNQGLVSVFAAPGHRKYPAVTVRTLPSMQDYLDRHMVGESSDGELSREAIASISAEGITVLIDHSPAGDPGPQEHRVHFPAQFDPECQKPAEAITTSLGKWIDMDALEILLDVCGPCIPDNLRLREALLNLEGHEFIKATRSQASAQVVIGGDVKSSVEIPNTIGVALSFMGKPFRLDIPFRVRVNSGEIKFLFIDSGALMSAKVKIQREMGVELQGKYPNLLVIEGSLKGV